MSTYTEDHLVEKPAIQLMQHELGWDVANCYDEWSGGASVLGRDGKREVGGNIEHRTPNIERRSEEKSKRRLRPALQRLNPDLPVDHSTPRLRMAWAIEGAVEERRILNDGSVVAFGYAGTSFWILNGRGRSASISASRDSDIPCNWNP